MCGEWHIRKKHFLERLEKDLKIGRLDKDIYGLLKTINSIEYYYTTSSCSGRIQVYASKIPGRKFEIKTIGKWHRPISLDELLEVLKDCPYEDIWLAVLPPILHVVARNVEKANRLLHLAREAGFKHSGILSVKNERVIMELTSSERIETPLRMRGVWIFSDENLLELIRRANELLLVTKRKIRKFEELLKSLC